MSTHTPQPLIWLARNSTSPSVAFGTPLFPTADDNSWSAFMASGRIIAGLFILDCIIVSPPLFTLLCLPWLVYLRKQLNLIHQYSDESPGRNVTGRLLSHFRLRYGSVKRTWNRRCAIRIPCLEFSANHRQRRRWEIVEAASVKTQRGFDWWIIGIGISQLPVRMPLILGFSKHNRGYGFTEEAGSIGFRIVERDAHGVRIVIILVDQHERPLTVRSLECVCSD